MQNKTSDILPSVQQKLVVSYLTVQQKLVVSYLILQRRTSAILLFLSITKLEIYSPNCAVTSGVLT